MKMSLPSQFFRSFRFGISISADNPISYEDGFWQEVWILCFLVVIIIYVCTDYRSGESSC